MDFTEYQHLARRTLQCEMTDLELKCNVVFGLVGETGEIVDLLKKHLFHRHSLNLPKLWDEIGDCLWYLSALASIYDLSLDIIAQENIAKLTRRYPDGFSYEDSQNRRDISTDS